MAAEKSGQGRIAVETGVGAYQITGARPERGSFARFTRSEEAGRAALEAA